MTPNDPSDPSQSVRRRGRAPREAHPVANGVVVALKALAKRLPRGCAERKAIYTAVRKGGTISLSTFLDVAVRMDREPGGLLTDCVEEAKAAMTLEAQP